MWTALHTISLDTTIHRTCVQGLCGPRLLYLTSHLCLSVLSLRLISLNSVNHQQIQEMQMTSRDRRESSSTIIWNVLRRVLPLNRSESISDVSASHSRSSPDSYPLSPVSSFVSSPTLPTTPSQWTPAYINQGEDRHTYSSSDSRLRGGSYGPASPYPQYPPGIQRYAPVTSGAHTLGHDRYNDYDAAPLAWSHKSSYRPAQSPSRHAYEYTLDSEAFQSCVLPPIILSPQPMTPIGPFEVSCP